MSSQIKDQKEQKVIGTGLEKLLGVLSPTLPKHARVGGEISSDLYRQKKLLPKLNHFDPLIVVGDLR